VLGGLAVKKVIAVGESQSAIRLSIYLNSVHPLTGNIFDAALETDSGGTQRNDLSIPIIKILTETELTLTLTNETLLLQPDTEKYKTWQVTGAMHTDLTATLPRSAMLLRDLGRMIGYDCTVPTHGEVL
jgi:hypothetical protein